MKTSLSWVAAGLLALVSTGCIYVRVKGDLDDEFRHDDFGLGYLSDDDDDSENEDEDESGFHGLSTALEDCLTDPSYTFDLSASPWRTKSSWTVRYAGPGSDGHAAFVKAREAVLQRIEREGGTVREQHDDGTHAWSCSFRVHGEPGEASVRLNEHAGEDEARPHQLEIVWERSD